MADPNTLVHAMQAVQFFKDRGKTAMADAIQALIDEGAATLESEVKDEAETKKRVAAVLEPLAGEALRDGADPGGAVMLSQAISAKRSADATEKLLANFLRRTFK